VAGYFLKRSLDERVWRAAARRVDARPRSRARQARGNRGRFPFADAVAGERVGTAGPPRCAHRVGGRWQCRQSAGLHAAGARLIIRMLRGRRDLRCHPIKNAARRLPRPRPGSSRRPRDSSPPCSAHGDGWRAGGWTLRPWPNAVAGGAPAFLAARQRRRVCDRERRSVARLRVAAVAAWVTRRAAGVTGGSATVIIETTACRNEWLQNHR